MVLDEIIFRWLNSWAGVRPLWDSLIVFRAVYLWYIIMAAVAFFVVVTFFSKFREYRRRNIELFILTFVSAFTARFMVTELVRIFYNRPRPFEILENVRQLVDHAVGDSFPSGHASLAFAVATTVSFHYPKTSILFFAAAFSIGFGRVAAGVHWPSDILGGAIVGVGTAWFFRLLFLQYKKRRATPSYYSNKDSDIDSQN